MCSRCHEGRPKEILTARQPTVLTGVTNRPERNGGPYSKTRRLTNSSKNTLPRQNTFSFD